MEYIDLRSDTVTKPTPEMREAMAKAEVGDDVYGDDPTVNRLQEMAAEMTGHEAGLFVASGTMGNLSAVLAHCQRGDEVILGKEAHTYRYEAGGVSVLGGVHSCQLPNQPDGSIALNDIEGAIRADDPHQPITRLIALENTHNRCGGTYQSAEYTCQVAEFAHARGLKVHLDGARVFNASAALGVNVRELTAPVDSVTFCLSKGLSAPVGSVLCGSQEFIKKAHRVRKLLGGGMRQAGVLAAAGIVALEKMAPRLGEDHARARTLAEGLSGNRGLVLDAGTPATNMVFLNLAEDVPLSTTEVAERMKEHGVLVGVAGARRFRLVTHCWIDDESVKRAIVAFSDVLIY
ncbi:MAG: low-specificity L-threonine aldolase [Anaerolineales bacterium]|nr:low-specificity L-threonine aldolase [Anaerolineales bacterium]